MTRTDNHAPHEEHERVVNGTPTPADDLLALASGPAILPKVVYGTIDRSMLRKIPVPLEGHQWPAAPGGLVLPIGPSTTERVNLLESVELFGTPSAGVSPSPFIFGTPGAGHTMRSKETR